MVKIGCTMMGEQAGPPQLVTDVVRAEAAGFDFAVASDHYVPWLEEQGHDVEAGFTDVALVQIGEKAQESFLQWAEDVLLPALRRL